MGKLAKVIGIFILLVLVVIAGLIAFVRYYLTEERVKALVIPQAETALGRKVEIGDIKIGLLSGITIRDFLIKEADKETNFVSTRAFVLSYELLPLLQKKLIISEIRFDEPAVRIIRDKNGKFNFSTLAILSDGPQKKEAEKPKPAASALPLALTINQIKFNKAKIKIEDQLEKIPTVDATTSAKVNVALGQNLKDLRYKGSFDFDAALAHGGVQTKLKGKGNISQNDMDIILDSDLDGEQAHVEADVKSYMQSPNATLTLSSKSLNIDKLLAIVAALAKTDVDKPQKSGPAKEKSGDIIADSLPKGMVAKGTVKVDKAIYQGLNANNVSLAFDLANGALSVDFGAAVAKGDAQAKVNGKGNIRQNNMAIILDTDLEGEQVHAEADVKSYMQSPNATITITSKSLNIDKLLGLVAALPKAETEKPQKSGPAKDKSVDIIADSLPQGLVAKGTVNVDKAMYKALAANNFSLAFDLAKGVLTVKELSAKAYDGKLDSKMTVDLNQPGPAYDGHIGLQAMQAADLSSSLMQRLAGMLTGSLQSGMNFSGAGTTWQQISKVLTADGSFTLTDGGIKGTPVALSIANLLGLKELNNISYKNIGGTFIIVEGGKLKIKTNMQGEDLDAEAEGVIGLDGSLDLPLTLHLSPALADKLKSRASFAKYLTDDQGGSTLHLKLAGNLKSPQPTLNMKGVQDKMQKTIQKEIFKQLDGSEKEAGEKQSPKDMIKGIFGK